MAKTERIEKHQTSEEGGLPEMDQGFLDEVRKFLEKHQRLVEEFRQKEGE